MLRHVRPRLNAMMAQVKRQATDLRKMSDEEERVQELLRAEVLRTCETFGQEVVRGVPRGAVLRRLRYVTEELVMSAEAAGSLELMADDVRGRRQAMRRERDEYEMFQAMCQLLPLEQRSLPASERRAIFAALSDEEKAELAERVRRQKEVASPQRLQSSERAGSTAAEPPMEDDTAEEEEDWSY